VPQYHIFILNHLFLLLHLLGVSLALKTILLPSSKIIINLLNLLLFYNNYFGWLLRLFFYIINFSEILIIPSLTNF
jgi:hypothetical protein